MLASRLLQGKVCLVTGASSGIGKATALGLAHRGAHVVMACRDLARGAAAQNEIQAHSGNPHVDLMQVDLASQESIRQFVAHFKDRYTHLHILINNAGISNFSRQETEDGIEETLAVNYLAPFLLTNLLLDTIKESAPARIINVSSDMQSSGTIDLFDLQLKTGRYSFPRAYSQSKLALILFTYALARRLEGTGVTVNCLHPGFVATNIGQQDLGPVLKTLVGLLLPLLGSKPDEGARTTLYLATSPEVEGVTGKYFIKGVPKKSALVSYDRVLQERLWEESLKLTHLESVAVR
ncbi:NAD(P)-dependent dehydrogenase (short-subunit alcohol dehydrogenase family) [Thermosporothrix hazakensis]|jgi:NAD(P)-dependent dehydrogenase (short-subunit alcohol dehydrogenase family)|uniref:NAD(P)-dependent dehydrogenase (Short-subunit alcohol dehydrogenase family) n=1 Tax=Thermosporothrix hazakensis TaxID=644383 RepID=A0A326U6A2_THEHA|nr:SDR family oxidoreductase [Thermosporothrix hazakensis]PZW29491.1 NAD(P)-dependent dehydrogenase (short-subunit alcohol dehydrogenase family) [Thermosporothrix hazakensis]GCE45794.1 retinol dehydrogenase [Thermosporothrix hazakensis]